MYTRFLVFSFHRNGRTPKVRQEVKTQSSAEKCKQPNEIGLGCGELAIDVANTRASQLATPPKLFQEVMMIKLHSIKENTRSRRDAQRKAKQQAWALSNPLSVGRKYQANAPSVSLVRRAGYSPVPLRAIARTAFGRVKAYKMQIIRASYLFEYEFKRKPVIEGNWRGKEDHNCESIRCDRFNSEREKSNIK